MQQQIVTGEILSAFDYAALESEVRVVLMQEDKEFDRNMDDASQGFVRACHNLRRIHQALRYKRPGFEAYCDSKAGLARATAYRMLTIAEKCPESGHFPFAGREVFYILAAPSVPPAALDEAVQRAESGETIDRSAAKEIVQAAKAETAARRNGTPPATPALDDIRAAIAAGPHRWSEARALIGQLPPPDRPDWIDDLACVEQMDAGFRQRDTAAAWEAFTDLADPQLRGLLEPLYANAAAQLGLVWPPAKEVEAAPAISPFDRHTLEQLGWSLTGKTYEDADGVWHYELTAPPTGSGKRATLWKTMRGIGAIVSGMEAPPAEPDTAMDDARAIVQAAKADLERPALLAGRPPYGAAGSGRWLPVVASVLIIGERRSFYDPPPIARAATIYDTATTVRCQRGDKPETQASHKVWCVPDDTAWQAIEQAHAAFTTALSDLAEGLRELGRYKEALEQAGGFKAAPNPLCLTVARGEDPDKREYSYWWMGAWHVPRVKREAIERHTPKMLSGGDIGSYTFSQDGCFVLADDAAWQRIDARYQAAENAAAAMNALLERLGTYQAAVEDQRYSGPAAAAAAPAQSRWHVDANGKEWPGVPDGPPVPWDTGLPADFAAYQARVEALGARLEIEADIFVVVEGDDTTEFADWPVCQAYIHAMEAEDAPAPPVAVVEEDEDLEAQLRAAGEQIITGLSEPACRVLARLMCFNDEAEQAFTAPIAQVRAGFATVWGMNSWIGEDEAPALRATLAQLAARPTLPPRPAVAARGDVSEQLRELHELRAWADQVARRLEAGVR